VSVVLLRVVLSELELEPLSVTELEPLLAVQSVQSPVQASPRIALVVTETGNLRFFRSFFL
jgi:hypothetical protein